MLERYILCSKNKSEESFSRNKYCTSKDPNIAYKHVPFRCLSEKTHYGKIADLWRAIIKDTHKEAWETIEYKRKYKIAEKKRVSLPEPPEGDLVDPYITFRCFYNIFTKVISLKNVDTRYETVRFSEVLGLKIKVH